MLTLLTNDLV